MTRILTELTDDRSHAVQIGDYVYVLDRLQGQRKVENLLRARQEN